MNLYSLRKKCSFCIALFIFTVCFTCFLIFYIYHLDVHDETNNRKHSTNILAKQISLSFTVVPQLKHVDLEQNYGTSLVGDLYVSGFSAIGNKVCPNNGSELQLLIIVLSRPSSKYHRLSLRRTWGTVALRKDVSIAFLLGKSYNVPERKIYNELELYEDLIISNNIDNYQNLTLKSVSMLEYVSTRCNFTRFVLKLDDDVYVHTTLLLKILKYLDDKRRGIYGKAIKNVGPVREENSKHYVSWNLYKIPLYPCYMNGPAYLFPAHITGEMYAASFLLPYVPMEDVFITGILAERLNITRYENEKFRIVDLKNEPVKEEMFFFHRTDVALHFMLWYMFHKPKLRKVRFIHTKHFLSSLWSVWFNIGS